GIEEVSETVAPLVLARSVVRVGQTRHVNHAHLLTQALLRDRLTRRHRTRHHNGAIALDHAPGAVASGVRVRLGVAGYVLDLAAQQAISLQGYRLQGIQQAAVALPVDVLDGKLIALELV